MLENRLKKIRKTKGLTLQEVADKCHPTTVSPQIMKLEKGERGLDLNWMDRLSKALDCKPYELLPEEWQPAVANNTDIQLVINIVDTLNFFLKKEKAEMSEENRTKLIKYLYEKNTPKEQIVPTIEIWMEANPNMFKKIA